MDVCHTCIHTRCGLGANLRCRSEKCCTRLAANTGHKKIVKNLPSGHHRTTLSGYIFVIKARINNRKKLVKQQYLFHISPNMVNFGPLTAEIDPVVCDTPENFNGFRVLAVTAAMSLNGRQPNFARWLAVFWAGTQHIHFWGFLPRYGFSLCVQVLRSRILAALLHGGWLVGV